MSISAGKRPAFDALADRLATAWTTRTRLSSVGEGERPANRAEAFYIQGRMLDGIGGAPSGWKVGATSAKMRALDGHDDIVPGCLLEAETWRGPRQTIDLTRYPEARIEAEFAFRLERDLPVREAPYTAAEVRGAIVLLPALEIIGDRLPRGDNAVKPGTLLTIADNGGGWGFVAGDPVTGWQDVDFARHHVSLTIDGGPESDNFLDEMRADPVAVVADLANMLGPRGIALKAGDFVTTGAAAVPMHLRAGTRLAADFGRLGRLDLELV